MTSELVSAARAYRRAGNALAQRRAQLAESIAEAARNGARPGVIVEITGLTRERVRQILRAAGIEP